LRDKYTGSVGLSLILQVARMIIVFWISFYLRAGIAGTSINSES